MDFILAISEKFPYLILMKPKDSVGAAVTSIKPVNDSTDPAVDIKDFDHKMKNIAEIMQLNDLSQKEGVNPPSSGATDSAASDPSSSTDSVASSNSSTVDERATINQSSPRLRYG